MKRFTSNGSREKITFETTNRNRIKWSTYNGVETEKQIMKQLSLEAKRHASFCKNFPIKMQFE